MGWSREYPAHENPIDAKLIACTGGCAGSKWIAEQILLHYAATANLRSVIARVGQLTGLPSGAWNASKWVPSIILSAKALKSLPDVLGTVPSSWLPMMSAARMLASLKDNKHLILHLIHPRPVPRTVLFTSVASELDVSLIPYPT